MAAVKQGDTVTVNYTGKLDTGVVFDSSYGRSPIKVTLGQGKLIAGFEKAVIGMNTGEKKTVVIPSAEAYGSRHDQAVVEIERKNLPEGFDAQVGQRLELTQEDNTNVLVTVTAVTERSITVDANHPLAGKDLTFEIEVVKIGP